MTGRPSEEARVHTRLLKCTLEVENARAYWQHVASEGEKPSARQAFEGCWFGARSLPWVKVLLANFRARFDAYPAALAVLARWADMSPDTRRLICHWHLQLSDPLYRAFTGRYLVERHEGPRPEVTRDLVVKWIGQQEAERWGLPTRIQLASKLLSSALSAGLVKTNRDPRPLLYPRVGDEALTYLMFLLREVEFAGSLLDNPYTASVGLTGGYLEERLRGLSALHFRRQGDLVDFGWRYPSLGDWASASLFPNAGEHAGGAR